MATELVSRRTFLKLAGGVVAGVAVAEVAKPVEVFISNEVKRITQQPVGNAAIREDILNGCKPKETIDECVEKYLDNPENQVRSIVKAPIVEEIMFRAAPSLVLSEIDTIKDLDEKKVKPENEFTYALNRPYKEVFTGTKEFKFTRRELIAGAISSLIFGYAHNITDKGIDLQTIPTYQISSGMIFWYLQRRFGILANVGAHAWVNFSAYFRRG